jgi:hypothetical protein
MKPQILLLAFFSAVAFSSCTTAYKTAQTPDDVYYSPARPEDEYVRVEEKDSRRYEGSDEYYDDRYLRMKVRNRSRWSDLDDYYYFGNNRYNYGYYHNSWNNPWNPYTYWNCTYNPYYTGVVIVKPSSPNYTKPRFFNLNTYNNNTYNPSNIKTQGSGPRTTYSNQSNTNSNAGNILRNIFSGNNSSNNSNNSSSSPTKTTSSSSSGSSSGSSGSSAPVRRF